NIHCAVTLRAQGWFGNRDHDLQAQLTVMPARGAPEPLPADDMDNQVPRRTDGRPPAAGDLASWPDAALLETLQRAAFEYFPRNSDPVTGLVADTSRARSPCSIAVVGFALAAYPIGVERGWIARADAVQRILAALRFFDASDQS